MNAGKTSAVWLGSKRNSVVKYMQHLEMEWNSPKCKVLGIWFTTDLDNCEKNNYSEKFAEVKCLLRIWMKRLITQLKATKMVSAVSVTASS